MQTTNTFTSLKALLKDVYAKRAKKLVEKKKTP